MRRFALLSMVALTCVFAAEFPQSEISNGVVTAKLYLPDAERGYYRGTRFDWSGQIYSLKTQGNEYFGQWFEKYDPKLHDSIMGPVEEFGVGSAYDEAKPGELFVRIGIGAVRKTDDTPYQRFKTYEIVDPGTWKIEQGKDSIRMTHTLRNHNGYAYTYVKIIRLTRGKPEMVIEHTLKNTGPKRIAVSQYNHNFFVMNNQPTGPGVTVKFPFTLKPTQPFKGDFAENRGNEIVYLKELQAKESAFANFEGSSAPGAYDFQLAHAKAGAAVRITGDQPISKIVYWSIRSTFCPEAYIDLAAEPGREVKWRYTYSFSALPK